VKWELLFLGSGNAFAPGRAFSSFLLNRRILFEASPTTLPALKARGISLRKIQYLLISHFHGDHCFGLPFIFLDHYFMTRRKEPMTIIGPKGLERKTNQMIDLAYPDVRRRYAQKFPVKFVEVTPGGEYKIGEMVLKVHKMFHGALSLGFNLTCHGRQLAYCGDAGPSPELSAMLREAHVAVLEMTTVADRLPSHLNRRDIFKIRKQLRPETRMILTHLPALTRSQAKTLVENPYGALALAEDGKIFTFTL
jgi:ribonuclease BN (tRNA processing enzyme)